MTTKRVAVMKQLLGFTGIEPDRLRLEWVSAAEAPQFARAITEFTHHIRLLGPSRLKAAGSMNGNQKRVAHE